MSVFNQPNKVKSYRDVYQFPRAVVENTTDWVA